MCYNFSEEETNTIFQTLLMIENIANQFAKKNDTKYNNKKIQNMGKIITVIDNELSIDDKLDTRFIENEAILPSSPTPSSGWKTSERKYETLITDPWDTNRNICSKAMKGENKYVSQAIYEKKIRNLKRARSIKFEKQNLTREKKSKREKALKTQSGMVSKRRRESTNRWDPSVPTKWSSINSDFILIDF
jgi:hypothetical protein